MVAEIARGGRKDARVVLQYERIRSLLGIKSWMPTPGSVFASGAPASASSARLGRKPMPASVVVAGLDGRSLLLEAPVLQRERHAIIEAATGRAVVEEIVRTGAGLVVLGARLPDIDLPEAVRRIRASALARHVSILVLLAAGEPSGLDEEVQTAGANGVLRRPLDPAQLEAWIAKLVAVARRVETRVPVQGRVVGTPRHREDAHFYGLSRNLSVTGMLLASPVRLAEGPDLELEFDLPGGARPACRPWAAWCGRRARWPGRTSATAWSSSTSPP